MDPKLIIAVFIIMCNFEKSEGFLSWLFNPNSGDSVSVTSEGEGSQPAPQASTGQAMKQRVPFEVKSADDKFLSSGRELMMAGLSELDSCHHTVVAQLKTSCNDITEEELAKMGVALLNCQSRAEGRPTYTCTESMSVGECTSGMDPNTWNSYHIISNRARSVCYAVRQTQFQRQTQIAVNHLAASTEEQVYFMNAMQESHEALNHLATDTIEEMAEGQKILTVKQDKLKDSQVELQSKINTNLETLTKEKSLIAAGHKELASMTEDIKKQLEAATQDILAQDRERQHNHDQVVEDLASMQQKAKDAWLKVDQHMQYMTDYQHETANHYSETLTNLKKMNDTITYLLNVVHEMQSEVDERLGWITSLIGGAGENLALLSTCVLHGCYFVLAAMSATFLQTPVFTRLVLLLLVPLNAMAQIQHGVSLEMAPLTLVLIGVAIVNWITIALCAKVNQKSAEERSHVCHPLDNSPTMFKMPHQSLLQIPQLPHEDSRLHELSGDEDYTPSTGISLSEDDTATFMTDDDTSMVMNETTIRSTDPLMTTISGPGKGYLPDASFVANSQLQTPQFSSTIIPSPSNSFLSIGEVSMDPDKAKRHLGSLLETVTRGTPSPASSRDSSPARNKSRSSTPNKHTCSGQTKAGLQCRQTCTPGKDTCWRHITAK